jgi:poly(3-hydroxybutyrate) depolymerase
MQMQTLVMIGGLALLAGTGAAAQTQPDQSQSKSSKPADTITVHGCLTKGPNNTFVLTPTDAGDPLSSSVASKTRDVVPTYTYRLTAGQNLDAQVGQNVSATGKIDPHAKGKAEVEDTRETAGSPSSATPKGKTPTVKTETKAKIEVRQLIVQSVTPTGTACSARKGTS